MSFSINLNEYDTEYTVANINGSIFVPLEKISQHMNLTLEENKQTKSIEIINGDTVISFFADKKEAQVNSNTVLLKNPPFILNNDFYIPIRFLIESLEGKVSWECNSFYPNGHIHILQREYLETVGQFDKEGCDQVIKYLDLIDESSVRNVTEEEWGQVLSEKALKSGYGKNARVSRVKWDGNSNREFYIGPERWVESKRLISFDPLIYQYEFCYGCDYFETNDPTRKTATFVKAYTLVKQNGKVVIDKEQLVGMKYIDNLPNIKITDTLQEEIEEIWNKSNSYNYKEFLELYNTHINPILWHVDYIDRRYITKFNDASSEESKKNIEKLLFSPEHKTLKRFTRETRRNPSWNDFLNIYVRYNNFTEFFPIKVKSTNNHIMMTLYISVFTPPNSFKDNLGTMDVTVEKQDGKWIFTKIDNVKFYKDCYDLKNKEPQLYELGIKFKSYFDYMMRNR